MNLNLRIPYSSWQKFLEEIRNTHVLYAPIQQDSTIDYRRITDIHLIREIIYNTPKPITPLKLFFLPVKENVIKPTSKNKRIIMGVPSCDLEALNILDEFYLKEPFVDSYYKDRRENTLLIGTDCYALQEHCHCTTYGVNPFPERNADISLSLMSDHIYLELRTDKGHAFIEDYQTFFGNANEASPEELEAISVKRKEIIGELSVRNKDLLDYHQTGTLVKDAPDTIWEKFASRCVACGACATICPTCSCFLLVDRPGFEKVRQMDACQYPGFVRVAGGEDTLKDRARRFRNRYLCKYVYKPAKFDSTACTGCGRCIESCIAGIDKNELFKELTNLKKEGAHV